MTPSGKLKADIPSHIWILRQNIGEGKENPSDTDQEQVSLTSIPPY